MDDIYIIEGGDLDALTRHIAAVNDHGGVRKLSVAIDGGVKIKVNEYGWTAPMGTLREIG